MVAMLLDLLEVLYVLMHRCYCRSERADYNIDAYLASALKTSTCSLPGMRPMRFSGSQIIMPLAHTVENEVYLLMFLWKTCAVSFVSDLVLLLLSKQLEFILCIQLFVIFSPYNSKVVK